MILQPGQIYLVRLQLHGAVHFAPSWLVGAFAAKYPAADVAAIQEYASDHAVVKIRWRGPDAGTMAVGDRMSAVLEGLAMPSEALPSATIVAVEPAGETLPTVEAALPDSAKLLLAAFMIATTWYFARRIGSKHERSGTAGATAG